MTIDYISEVRLRAKNVLARLQQKEIDASTAEDLLVDISIGVMNILRREPILVTHASKKIAVKKGARTIKEFEEAAIREALEKTNGSITKAALRLEMNERTFHRRLKTYNLHDTIQEIKGKIKKI